MNVHITPNDAYMAFVGLHLTPETADNIVAKLKAQRAFAYANQYPRLAKKLAQSIEKAQTFKQFLQ